MEEYNKINMKNDLTKVNHRRLCKILHEAQDQFLISRKYQDEKFKKYTKKLSELVRKIKNTLEVAVPFTTHIDVEKKSEDVCLLF